MTQTQLPENRSKTLSPEVDLHPKLIDQLAGIVEQAEKTKKPESAQVSSWYYSVPCAGVRYYTYHDHRQPDKGPNPSFTKD